MNLNVYLLDEAHLASLDQSQRPKFIFKWIQKLNKKLDATLKNLSNTNVDQETEWLRIETEDKPLITQLILHLIQQPADELWCHVELNRMATFLLWKVCLLTKKDPKGYVKWLEDILIISKTLGDGKIFSLATEVLINIHIKSGQWEEAKSLAEEYLEDNDGVQGTRYLLYIAAKSGKFDELRDLLQHTKFDDNEFKYVVHLILELPYQHLHESLLLDVLRCFKSAEFYCLLVMISLDRGMKTLLVVAFSDYVMWYRTLTPHKREQASRFHERIVEYTRKEIKRVLLHHSKTNSCQDDLPNISQLSAALTLWVDQKGPIPENNAAFFQYLGYQVCSIRAMQGIVHLKSPNLRLVDLNFANLTWPVEEIGIEKAKEKILQFMKKKKMETSTRLQQMLLDLDITDNDFLVQQSNPCSRRISLLKSFNGGFQEWSQHMYFMLNAAKKNIQIENLTTEILLRFSAQYWYMAYSSGNESRMNQVENAIIKVSEDHFTMNSNKSEQIWLSQILWHIGLISEERNARILFQLAAMCCEGDSRTSCCIAQLGWVFAQRKIDFKIHELVLDGVNNALSSSQDNEHTTRILMIFRFNALVLMNLDLSPALIDAMERGDALTMSMMVSLLPPLCVKTRVQMLKMVVVMATKRRNDATLGLSALLALVRLFIKSGYISDVINLFTEILTIAQMSVDSGEEVGTGQEELIFHIIRELHNYEKVLFASDTFKDASKMIGDLVPSLLEFVPKYRSII